MIINYNPGIERRVPPPRLDKAFRAISSYNGCMSLPVLLAGISLCGRFAVARTAEFAWEGFEREINWEAYTSTAATARIVDDTIHSEGAHSLKLLFHTVANAHKAVYSRGVSANWSPFGALLLDVYNPTDLAGLTLGVVVQGGDWVEYEYRTPPLAKGWNRDVRVDFLQRHFSSAATHYKPIGYLTGRGEVKSLQIVVYPGTDAEGAVYLDNLRLERMGLWTAGPLGLNSTLDVIASIGNLDYVPPDLHIRPRDLTPLESFETGTTWSSWTDGVVIAPVRDRVSHGTASLSVTFPASPDGFEVRLDGMETRLAGRKQLRMDAYCEGPGASVTLILRDAAGGDYSQKTGIGHGWSSRVFDFTNPNAWDGGVIEPRTLATLTEVAVRIESRDPGRLVFDGLSAGDLSLKGAARAGGLLNLSYNPSPDVEAVADLRAEDTFYGSRARDARDGGPEVYLDAANVRFDGGEFRSNVLYRRRINPMDQPIFLLVSPWNLGTESAGVETAGRALNTEMQALAATRLEYGRYNSRVPTGFGPEQVGALRFRRTLVEGTRVGTTWIAHLARYGTGVTGIPPTRGTFGADAETHVGGKGFSVVGQLEGGVTAGLRPRAPDANAPGNDRFYVGTNISPQWGRLKLSGGYTQFGYDFDGDLTSIGGGGWAGPSFGGGLDLDGLPGVRLLARLPLYDHSVANNLLLSWGGYAWNSRDRFADPVTGRLKPRTLGRTGEIELANDEKAKPNFRLSIQFEESTDQWYRNPDVEQQVQVRFPLPWDAGLSTDAKWERTRTIDRTTGESGRGWKDRQRLSVDKQFPGGIFASVGGQWVQTRDSWLDQWGEVARHFKLTGGARATVGPNSTVELSYGYPALFGNDYGIQDTINVWTLTARVYF